MNSDSWLSFFLGLFLRACLIPINFFLLVAIFFYLKDVIENFNLSFLSDNTIILICFLLSVSFLLIFYLSKEKVHVDRKYFFSKIGFGTNFAFFIVLVIINPGPKIKSLYNTSMGGETETTYHIVRKNIYECDGRMVKNRYTGAEICDSTVTFKETTRTKTTNIQSILLEDGTKEIRCNSKGSRIIGFYDKEKNENTSVSTILKSLGMCEGNEYLKTKKGFEYVWEINQGALKIQDKCKKFYTKMQNEKGNYLKNEEEWRSCINQDYRTLTSEVKKPLTYQEFFDAYYNNVDIAD